MDKQGGRQMRISQEEIDTIKRSFRDNEELLKLLRKIFLPEIDPEAPIGDQIDLWMTVPLQGQEPPQALANLFARNQLITHVEQCLMQLNILANTDAKTLDEVKEQIKKDSNK